MYLRSRTDRPSSYPWRRGSKQSAAGTLSRCRECSVCVGDRRVGVLVAKLRAEGVEVPQGGGVGASRVVSQRRCAGPRSTLAMNVRSSGDGYNILNITTPTAYSEKTVEAFNTSLGGLHSTGIPAFTCPAHRP